MAFLYEHGRGKPTVVVDKSIFKAVLNDKRLQQSIAEYRQYLKNANFHEESGNLEEAKKWKTEAGKIKSQLPGWAHICHPT